MILRLSLRASVFNKKGRCVMGLSIEFMAINTDINC